MSNTETWFCPRGCNVFESSQHDVENPAECASCGCVMSLESDEYDDVHLRLEEMAIGNLNDCY